MPNLSSRPESRMGDLSPAELLAKNAAISKIERLFALAGHENAHPRIGDALCAAAAEFAAELDGMGFSPRGESARADFFEMIARQNSDLPARRFALELARDWLGAVGFENLPPVGEILTAKKPAEIPPAGAPAPAEFLTSPPGAAGPIPAPRVKRGRRPGTAGPGLHGRAILAAAGFHGATGPDRAAGEK